LPSSEGLTICCSGTGSLRCGGSGGGGCGGSSTGFASSAGLAASGGLATATCCGGGFGADFFACCAGRGASMMRTGNTGCAGNTGCITDHEYTSSRRSACTAADSSTESARRARGCIEVC
jgi:hypothetical protein